MTQSAAAASEAKKPFRRNLIIGCVVCLIVGLFIGHAITYHWMTHHEGSRFHTPFQAVLLSNGAVYYGKLQGYGTRYPVLTDVFYIMSKTDPQTKQVTNVLVKRGKELHGPDRMYLSGSQIVFVEPVGPDSKVAQLINEANH
jgi:small nuclear ribonucleoprotein (snRNP)-like protein